MTDHRAEGHSTGFQFNGTEIEDEIRSASDVGDLTEIGEEGGVLKLGKVAARRPCEWHDVSHLNRQSVRELAAAGIIEVTTEGERVLARSR